MKRTLLSLLVPVTLAACASTQAKEQFYLLDITRQMSPLSFSEQEGSLIADRTLEKGSYQFALADSTSCISSDKDAVRGKFNQALALENCQPINLKIYKPTDYRFSLVPGAAGYQLTISQTPEKQAPAPLAQTCPKWDGKPITVSVGDTFKEGETLRDYYSQQIATVRNGQVTLQPSPQSQGLLLLEPVTATPGKFTWDNATVYFVMTDRFENGNPDNDNSYGRTKDGADEIGTFHGGDLVGLTERLDHLEKLGVTAIWITAPYEQIHGWVGGGDKGDFKHYAYHGYYAQDFTRLDANMGTEEELRTLVDSAHQKGIRILFDVVMNHSGYATFADMQNFGFGDYMKLQKPLEEYLGEVHTDWTPGPGENWHTFNSYIDFTSPKFMDWWGKGWIRTDIAQYDQPGYTDQTMSLAYLPDFMTESTEAVGLPVFYKNKPDTKAVEIEGYTPRQYLVKWLSDWVAEYGIDGFRVDTAKHVELDAWAELKEASTQALADWKAANPDKKVDDKPFWMTGEVWGHSVEKTDYHTQGGFDSVINFSFQDDAKAGVDCFAYMEPVYAKYATAINSDPEFNVLSYLSSHDTALFYGTRANTLAEQKAAGTSLMLAPGAVQIYYGDESARPFGPTGSDPLQGTRSDMNWDDLEKPEYQQLLGHWQTLGQFRQRHPAIGAGQHKQVSEAPYAFSRTLGDDRVLVVYAGK